MLLSYHAYSKIISYHRNVCEREKTSYTHGLVISIASEIHWRATEDSSVGFINNIYIWPLFFLKLKKYYETSNKFACLFLLRKYNNYENYFKMWYVLALY